MAETATGWQDRFRDRLVSAVEAVSRVKDGDRLRLPIGAVPRSLVKALMARRDELRGVTINQAIPLMRYPFANEAGCQDSLQLAVDFISEGIRPGVDARLVDFAVTEYALGSKVQHDGRCDTYSADVFMARVSEPDARGFVSFGWGLWHSKTLARAARLAIAEVGTEVIRTGGDNFIHLSEFDLIVPEETPGRPTPSFVVDLPQERLDAINVIGGYVSTLVRDRDTIQLGTGTVSSSMGAFLNGREDLGIDTEMMAPSAVELVKSGAATGRYKTFHPNRATASVILPGCDFDYVDGNPQFELYDVEYVNNVRRISQIENLVAINQALAIDLTGQVTAESLDGRMWSGPGGQLMWTAGALFAPGGRAVTVLPSTGHGDVSRIVPQFPPGTVVTVPRTLVDWVVTEHGMVNLQGRTQRERAMELIGIAHPDHRADLRRAAERLFWP